MGTRADAVAVSVAITGQSAAEVVHAALVSAAERYAVNEPLIISGRERDAIRRGRVGTRRLRSHLRTFADLVDPVWAGPLHTELGRLAVVLGDVRDADVRFARYSASLRGYDLTTRTGGRALLQRCRRDRREARTRLLARLGSPEHAAVKRRLVAMIAAPTWLPGAASDAHRVLPRYAAKPLRRLHRSVRALREDAGDEALHAVRIAAKRARYAVDAIAPVFGPTAGDLVSELAEVQTILGTFHDAMISTQWLRSVAPQLPPAAAFVAGVISTDEERAAQLARTAWPQAWARMSKTRWWSW